MKRKVKPIGARFNGDLARLLEERGIGQDTLETKCRDNIKEFVAWLKSPPKIGKRKTPTTRQTSLARNSLRRELRRSLRKEFDEKLRQRTEQEIREELAVVKNCVSAREAWTSFSESGEIPQLCQHDYEEIFDSVRTKQEYEPYAELKKEMCALSLTDHLLNPILERDAYRHRLRIESHSFVRAVISYREGHATWSNAYRVLEPIVLLFTAENWEKIPEAVNRLVERLRELENTPRDQETEELLLRPLREIFHVESAPVQGLMAVVTLLINDTWRNELEETVKSAIERLENILKSLPNPKDILCVDAVRRVVEIFESDPGNPTTSIQTLEDATFLEHIDKCYGPCKILRHCTMAGGLDYAIVRKWSDRPDSYVKEAIQRAKEYLASQETN